MVQFGHDKLCVVCGDKNVSERPEKTTFSRTIGENQIHFCSDRCLKEIYRISDAYSFWRNRRIAALYATRRLHYDNIGLLDSNKDVDKDYKKYFNEDLSEKHFVFHFGCTPRWSKAMKIFEVFGTLIEARCEESNASSKEEKKEPSIEKECNSGHNNEY